MSTKGEATKKKIIRAAKRLFRLKGYGDTSIDDICRESGVKRGNLYFYFKSKEELARVAIDEAAEKNIPFLEAMMDDEPDPLRRIELMIDGIIAYYKSRGSKASCMFGTIAQEVGESNRVLADATNRFFISWTQLLSSQFDEAKDTGRISHEHDSTALSHLIISSLEGALILYKASMQQDAYNKTRDALKSTLEGLRL
jgi:TetR/AcrR family transcriptional repressor of nem operon